MLGQIVGSIKPLGIAGVAIAQHGLLVASPADLFYPRDIVASCKHLAGPEMPESMERPERQARLCKALLHGTAVVPEMAAGLMQKDIALQMFLGQLVQVDPALACNLLSELLAATVQGHILTFCRFWFPQAQFQYPAF